jgi:hypothetical protein
VWGGGSAGRREDLDGGQGQEEEQDQAVRVEEVAGRDPQYVLQKEGIDLYQNFHTLSSASPWGNKSLDASTPSLTGATMWGTANGKDHVEG